jgi:hypothetical protein
VLKILDKPENKEAKASLEKQAENIVEILKKRAGDISCNLNTVCVLSAYLESQVKLNYDQLSLFHDALNAIGLNSDKKVSIFELVVELPKISLFVNPSETNVQPLLYMFLENLGDAIKALYSRKLALETKLPLSNNPEIATLAKSLAHFLANVSSSSTPISNRNYQLSST